MSDHNAPIPPHVQKPHPDARMMQTMAGEWLWAVPCGEQPPADAGATAGGGALSDEQIAAEFASGCVIPPGNLYTEEQVIAIVHRSVLGALQQRRQAQPPAPAPYWSPEWVESTLTQHVRALGCQCETPLLGYVPNAGPRCRLCGVEPPAPALAVRREQVAELIATVPHDRMCCHIGCSDKCIHDRFRRLFASEAAR